MTKDDVRAAARLWGLRWPTSRPRPACPAGSRTGSRSPAAGLARVERAEAALRAALAGAGLPVRDLRVRDLGAAARGWRWTGRWCRRCRASRLLAAVAGFGPVTLDPRGFRSGSMNELLPDPVRYRWARRAIRAAATPAPNPLSMLTTRTPGAQAVEHRRAGRRAPRRRRRSPPTSAPPPPGGRSRPADHAGQGAVHPGDHDDGVRTRDRARRRGPGGRRPPRRRPPGGSRRRSPPASRRPRQPRRRRRCRREHPAPGRPASGVADEHAARLQVDDRVGPALEHRGRRSPSFRPGGARRAPSRRRAAPRGRRRSAPVSCRRRTRPRACRCDAPRSRSSRAKPMSVVRCALTPSSAVRISATGRHPPPGTGPL